MRKWIKSVLPILECPRKFGSKVRISGISRWNNPSNFQRDIQVQLLLGWGAPQHIPFWMLWISSSSPARTKRNWSKYQKLQVHVGGILCQDLWWIKKGQQNIHKKQSWVKLWSSAKGPNWKGLTGIRDYQRFAKKTFEETYQTGINSSQIRAPDPAIIQL